MFVFQNTSFPRPDVLESVTILWTDWPRFSRTSPHITVSVSKRIRVFRPQHRFRSVLVYFQSFMCGQKTKTKGQNVCSARDLRYFTFARWCWTKHLLTSQEGCRSSEAFAHGTYWCDLYGVRGETNKVCYYVRPVSSTHRVGSVWVSYHGYRDLKRGDWFFFWWIYGSRVRSPADVGWSQFNVAYSYCWRFWDVFSLKNKI